MFTEWEVPFCLAPMFRFLASLAGLHLITLATTYSTEYRLRMSVSMDLYTFDPDGDLILLRLLG